MPVHFGTDKDSDQSLPGVQDEWLPVLQTVPETVVRRKVSILQKGTDMMNKERGGYRYIFYVRSWGWL